MGVILLAFGLLDLSTDRHHTLQHRWEPLLPYQ